MDWHRYRETCPSWTSIFSSLSFFLSFFFHPSVSCLCWDKFLSFFFSPFVIPWTPISYYWGRYRFFVFCVFISLFLFFPFFFLDRIFNLILDIFVWFEKFSQEVVVENWNRVLWSEVGWLKFCLDCSDSNWWV